MAADLIQHVTCGQPGLVWTANYDWVPGVKPLGRDYRGVDGRRYADGEPLTCSGCGADVVLALWNGRVVLVNAANDNAVAETARRA